MCYSYNAPTMLPAGHRLATSSVQYTTSCNTQPSTPEDGQNNCPKHVEPTGIINKPLLLHLVSCLYYVYQGRTVKQISDNEIYLLIKYTKSVLWRVTKRLSYIQDASCLKVNGESRYEFHSQDFTASRGKRRERNKRGMCRLATCSFRDTASHWRAASTLEPEVT